MDKFVVLHVYDGEEGFMATYGPQVAMAHQYESMEKAACFNVGNHPDAEAKGKPYRVVVIPWESWNEFLVYSEAIEGKKDFRAYPNSGDTLTIHPS